jgi:hypothetical protein
MSHCSLFQGGADMEKAKKIPGSNQFDPGISLFIHWKRLGTDSSHGNRRSGFRLGRFSDFRIVLLARLNAM